MRPVEALTDEYRRQFALRSWSQILDMLPSVDGQLVIDLGCGIGDQTAELVARGARAIGIDVSDALLESARARSIPNAEFRKQDLRDPLGVEIRVDGIWCSFTAAYFPELGRRLSAWKEHLKPGGWIALIEVDNLFGHEPLSADTRALLDSYELDALASRRYDFHMGHKLSHHLQSAGFTLRRSELIQDRELSFDGPADPEVLGAWSARLDRLVTLQRFCGSLFPRLRDDYLAALANGNHRSNATVHCCVASA